MTSSPTIFASLLVILLGIVTLLQLVILHKTRRIHLATFTIRDDTSEIRRETESLFAQTQALLALERKLGLSEALPPLRGWAGSPDFLLVIADEVLSRKPQTVVECSSGASTVVIARCLQINGNGHVFSLEHDPEFANKTRRLLAKHGLQEWATVLDAPLQTRHTKTPWYAEEALPTDLLPVDLMVVDGPPQAVGPLARYPALPRLMPRLADRAAIIVDDTDRDDETEMLRRWQVEFPQLRQFNCYCEKGCVRIEIGA